MNVPVKKFDGSQTIDGYIEIPNFLDTCPVCHRSAELTLVYGFGNSLKVNRGDAIQLVMQCPRTVCKAFSIVNYKTHYKDFSGANVLDGYMPKNLLPTEFPETISEISPEFVEIYNQAIKAENYNLDKIAGVGFRKSLEFLIKDYLVKNKPEESDKIKKKALGNCIEEDVSNENIKLVAKRATWLGNDETHYVRVWNGKDISDLKMLIDLTIHWIDSEALTQKLIADMPDKTNKK